LKIIYFSFLGKYELLFEDGYIKRLPPTKMWPLEVTQSNEKLAPMGSKQDRRDKKRKIVVSELFKSYSKKIKS